MIYVSGYVLRYVGTEVLLISIFGNIELKAKRLLILEKSQ
jgi:hypothetical protein